MIRSAGGRDVEQLLALEESLFDNPMSERMLHHELVRGRGWVYQGCDGILGYVLLRFDKHLVDITRLGVSTTAQRKGIGKQLLDKALDGVSDAMLTVKKDNLPALRLYKQYGFSIAAHLVGAGALVLRRTTTSSVQKEG